MLYVRFDELGNRAEYTLDTSLCGGENYVWYECAANFNPDTDDYKLVDGELVALTSQEIADARTEKKNSMITKTNLALVRDEYEQRKRNVIVGVGALGDRKYNFDEYSRNLFDQAYQVECVGKGLPLPWLAHDNEVYSHTQEQAFAVMSAVSAHMAALFTAYQYDKGATAASGQLVLSFLNDVLDGTVY